MEAIITTGRFKYHDNSYDIVGYNQKKRLVIIEKIFQRSIYYGDYTKTQITRKLTKNRTIKIDNLTYDLSTVIGLEDE